MGVDVLEGENRASDNVPVKSRPSKKKKNLMALVVWMCQKQS